MVGYIVVCVVICSFVFAAFLGAQSDDVAA